MTEQALTKEWYTKLEAQAATSFVNLPIEFQLRGYDYNFISNSYLNFFKSEANTRADKLTLAKKFLKFIRGINKNRAREELGGNFFKCFNYFMENFADLVAKQDMIHVETLSVITDAIDKSQFIEDIISVDELQRRVRNLDKVKEKEAIIDTEWFDVEDEYKMLNDPKERDQYLLEVRNTVIVNAKGNDKKRIQNG